jgi:ribose transport system permease protein
MSEIDAQSGAPEQAPAQKPPVTDSSAAAGNNVGSLVVAPAGRFQRLAGANTMWTFLVLLALMSVFGVLRPDAFPSAFNIKSLMVNAAVLLVLSTGMTFVIITAGIDLSVGSVLVFSGVIAAKVMAWLGTGADSGFGPIAAGMLAGVLAGTAWGVLNGLLITKAHIPALIATLGTMGMALGFAQLITGGVDVRDVPTKLTDTIGNGTLVSIPLGGGATFDIAWLMVIAAVISALAVLLLEATRFGRYTLAIGSSAEATRRVGIKVDRHLIKVYALSGTTAGIAGVLSLAEYTTTTIGAHANESLNAIAAVVLGGTSLFGGVGTVLGTVLGVFIPAVLQNGFVILGVSPFWQSVAVGAVLIVAVYFDQLRRRARERR